MQICLPSDWGIGLKLAEHEFPPKFKELFELIPGGIRQVAEAHNLAKAAYILIDVGQGRRLFCGNNCCHINAE
jgi:hypothetical protein